MRRFIHKLRQKPKSTRRKIAFGASASITGVIFAVWLTVMIAGGGVGTVGTNTAQSQAASPLGALGGNAGSALSTVQERLAGTSTATTTPTATTTQPKSDQSGQLPSSSQPDRSQPIERKPYWETKDTKDNNATQSSSEGSTDNNQPPSEAGSEFWSDDADNEKNGWF